jgi:seryl-tRNA synthetase
MMTIWEQAVLNIQRGARKVAAFAATFAERVRAEISVVRLRIRIEEVQSRINELYRLIGKRLVSLHTQDALPKASEQLLKDDDVAAALVELADREQEIIELNNEIKNIQTDVWTTTKHTEDHLL